MVSVNLKGGLGNMMFQIAFIEDLARRGGFEVVYPNIEKTFATLLQSGHSQNCFDYLNIFKNFDWKKNQDVFWFSRKTISIPHKFVEIEPEDNVTYDGYFQSERYFDREETLRLFEPSDEIKNQVEEILFDNQCSIHVRRGDYISKYSDTYEKLGNEYYHAAKDIIKASIYLWFGDEFPKSKDYIELFAMAQCDHNIIANSSFSWWGAYLNQNPDKKVIAPARWYKPGCKYSAQDIYTSNMIII